MSGRATSWFAWLLGGLAFAFAITAELLIELNGGEIGSSDTTGAVILALSFAGVGAFVASQRPANPIGWVLLIGGFFNSLNGFSFEYAEYTLLTAPGSGPGGPFFTWLSTWAFALGFAAFPLTLLLFPTGRPPSPRWRPVLWFVVLGVALMVVPMAAAAWPLRGPALANAGMTLEEIVGDLGATLQRVGIAFNLVSLLISAVSVIMRFRRSRGEERQQLKWLVYAGALTFVVTITASPAAPFNVPEAIDLVFGSLALLALPSIPVAVGIAILKHRLYDIDLVINRTLVYGVLTVTLVTVYVSGVVGLQYLFRTLTGQESQLAVVASTLAIAALFGPLRRRIQAFIDRRFYRKKYDASKTLAAFGAKLRDETDLHTLSEDLVGVVRETMQPTHVSLWLRPAHRAESHGRAEEARR